jgi:hypothetical protein
VRGPELCLNLSEGSGAAARLGSRLLGPDSLVVLEGLLVDSGCTIQLVVTDARTGVRACVHAESCWCPPEVQC